MKIADFPLETTDEAVRLETKVELGANATAFPTRENSKRRHDFIMAGTTGKSDG